MFADSDGDGRLDRWTTFAEGFRFAVGVLPRPDGAVYVVTRQSIALVRDTDGDGQADERSELVRLESEDDYPHNGLEGIALAPDGSLLFGLGENHGMAYTLTGSDGSQLKGKGGVDGIFRATPDGGKLEHYAGGCWNPFSICVDPRGRLFAVDNDPDASPPCRLLHIVPGGDYGYLFQYGRAGTHPLQAWNGELPGTLPMVCGVGEAPTAIVAHAGRLWVTSWGDHRVEAYRLVPRGASFTAEREVVVQGDTDFRPTGLAVAPDGSLYFGDWISATTRCTATAASGGSRCRPTSSNANFPPLSADEQHAHVAAAMTRSTVPSVPTTPSCERPPSNQLAKRSRPRRNSCAIECRSAVSVSASSLRCDVSASKPDESILRNALADESPDVRLYAVRWIADERIVALRDDVAKLLDGAAAQPALLSGRARGRRLARPRIRSGDDEGRQRRAAGPRAAESTAPAAVHALALRLLSPDNKFLTVDRLRGYLQRRLRAVATRSRSHAGPANESRALRAAGSRPPATRNQPMPCGSKRSSA